MQLLQEPRLNRCWVCHEIRFAIASQVLIHRTSGYPYRRWLCKGCGNKRGIHPTPEYLKNFREMDEGDESEVSLKVLTRV